MNPKTAIVTGASSGIGYSLAAELLQRGLKVIAISRYSVKAGRAMHKLKKKGNLDWIPTDLASMETIRTSLSEIKQKYQSLNYLFAIAGCLRLRLQKTTDDLEYMFQTNYLGHFLLINKLIPLLKLSEKARILIISGEGHRNCLPEGFSEKFIDYDKLLSIENFESGLASQQIILAKILFSYQLASYLKASKIETCTFCPGMVRTNILSGFPWHQKLIANFQLLFQDARSPSDLAPDIIKLAIDFQDINGRYFLIRDSGIRMELSSEDSYMSDYAKRLWNISEYLTNERFDQNYFETC